LETELNLDPDQDPKLQMIPDRDPQPCRRVVFLLNYLIVAEFFFFQRMIVEHYELPLEPQDFIQMSQVRLLRHIDLENLNNIH
jgi:hypothetical protein